MNEYYEAIAIHYLNGSGDHCQIAWTDGNKHDQNEIVKIAKSKLFQFLKLKIWTGLLFASEDHVLVVYTSHQE